MSDNNDDGMEMARDCEFFYLFFLEIYFPSMRDKKKSVIKVQIMALLLLPCV